ncbi:MAG: NADH-quinone oxidoreductase subunit C [Gammaproteobacteria bacterium]|nr:NADH-quinone oxidoreductase subunit C [Gammaproteobacteria bacterium]
MSQTDTFESALRVLADKEQCQLELDRNEFTLIIKNDQASSLLTQLRDGSSFKFDQLMDVAGIDYLEYGKTEWKTKQATGSGFSRGVSENTFGRFKFDDNPIDDDMQTPRFAVVYHLLSVVKNQRLRVKIFCQDNEMPMVNSVCSIWNCANWYEREAFDLYGIVFNGHPDMRRLLTDYGFVGHPLRKDFPLVGHVEVRYEPSKQRVIYEPVSIEPRVLVPKVIREDNRYSDSEEPNAEES